MDDYWTWWKNRRGRTSLLHPARYALLIQCYDYIEQIPNTRFAPVEQPPVVLHGIDGRYATALFTAAQKQDVLDKVESDLAAIKDLMDKDDKFRFFMETPIISREAKKAGVKATIGAGRYSKITSNFFETLADNGRLDQTPKIVTAFSQLLMAARGQVNVTVTSAKVRRASSNRVGTGHAGTRSRLPCSILSFLESIPS